MSAKASSRGNNDGDNAAGGVALVFLFMVYVVVQVIIHLIWWILASLLVVASGLVVLAILREQGRRKQAYAAYAAVMAARADEQNNWTLHGDDRGIYGTQGARLMQAVRNGTPPPTFPSPPPGPALIAPPQPWSTGRLTAMIAAVTATAGLGAFLFVNHPWV